MDDKSHTTAICRCNVLFMPTSQIKHVCKRAPRLILSVPSQPKYYAYVLWCLGGICYRSILSWVSGLLQWHWENKTFICSKTSDIDIIDIRYHWTESYWREVSNNSYKDQASNSRKAIIWTNEDSIALLVNVTLSIEVLIKTHKHNIWITDVSDSPLHL